MKQKRIIGFIFVCFLTLLVGSLSAFAYGNIDYANDAPGGNVANIDEFIKALGEDNAIKVSETEIKLINSVVLNQKINITNGKYTLTALGCTIYRGFSSGPLIELDGSTIGQSPSLSLGKADSAAVLEGIEPDLIIDGCADTYPNAYGALIMGKGDVDVNVYGKVEIRNASNTEMGGAIYVELGIQTESDYKTPLEPNVTIKNCVFKNCSAGIGGGAVAMYCYFEGYNAGNLVIENVRFTGNSSPTGMGGAIYTYGGNIDATTLFLNDNTADKGGAIYCASKGEINDIESSNNKAISFGGVLYGGADNYISAELTLFDFYAENNSSEKDGGVIVNEGKMIGKQLYFSGNTCNRNGGALYNTGSFELQEGSFMHNEALVSGGGVYCTGTNSQFILTGGEVNSNDAKFAGAIYCGGTLKVTGGAIGRNDSLEPHLVLKGKVIFGVNANILASNTIGLCVTKDKNGNEYVPVIEIDGEPTTTYRMYTGFYREKLDDEGNVVKYTRANKNSRFVFLGSDDVIKLASKYYCIESGPIVSYIIKEDGYLSFRFLKLPVWAWCLILPAAGAAGYAGYRFALPVIKQKITDIKKSKSKQ